MGLIRRFPLLVLRQPGRPKCLPNKLPPSPSLSQFFSVPGQQANRRGFRSHPSHLCCARVRHRACLPRAGAGAGAGAGAEAEAEPPLPVVAIPLATRRTNFLYSPPKFSVLVVQWIEGGFLPLHEPQRRRRWRRRGRRRRFRSSRSRYRRAVRIYTPYKNFLYSSFNGLRVDFFRCMSCRGGGGGGGDVPSPHPHQRATTEFDSNFFSINCSISGYCLFGMRLNSGLFQIEVTKEMIG